MKRLLTLVVLAIPLLMGMTSPPPTVYYAAHATGWRIHVAAQSWTDTGVVTFVRVDSCAGLTPCVDIWERPMQDEPADWAAFTLIDGADPGHPQITVNQAYRYLPRRFRRQATCHELGHVLNYQHALGSCMEPVDTGVYPYPPKGG